MRSPNWLSFVNGVPLGHLALLVLIVALAVAMALLFLFLARSWLVHQKLLPQGTALRRELGKPLIFLLDCLFLYAAAPVFPLNERLLGGVSHVLEIGCVLGATWFFLRVIGIVRQIVYFRYQIDSPDNLIPRKVITQIQFVHRTMVIFISTLGLSGILLSFEGFRRFGESLLASAGVAGVVVGFAAQKSLANFVAGFQIAFTQPVRLDDVVIVEGEWGRVEEITLTYVVVKIWDLRRLVLPITYFIEKPFQNWTRTSSELLGTIFLYVDYRTNVAALREEVKVLVAECALWDGKVCSLAVTNVT